MRQAKIQPLRECDLISNVVLWDILADVIRISAKAAEAREVEESLELMAGDIEWEVEPSKEEIARIQKEETFLVKMLKELDVASRKGVARKEKERSKKSPTIKD